LNRSIKYRIGKLVIEVIKIKDSIQDSLKFSERLNNQFTPILGWIILDTSDLTIYTFTRKD